jgi:hypothetical protein
MFRLTLLTLWLVAPAELLAQPKDSGDKSDFDKLFARCVDSSALVFAPEDRKEPIQRAGALVLNREKRLLLAPHTNVADEPTVVGQALWGRRRESVDVHPQTEADHRDVPGHGGG